MRQRGAEAHYQRVLRPRQINACHESSPLSGAVPASLDLHTDTHTQLQGYSCMHDDRSGHRMRSGDCSKDTSRMQRREHSNRAIETLTSRYSGATSENASHVAVGVVLDFGNQRSSSIVAVPLIGISISNVLPSLVLPSSSLPTRASQRFLALQHATEATVARVKRRTRKRHRTHTYTTLTWSSHSVL